MVRRIDAATKRVLTTILLGLALPAHAAELHVIDGDSFVLAGETVRIENVDTPEIGQAKCDAERRLGLVAKRELERILTAGEIGLRRAARKDRYGRTIAKVTVNGKDAGEQLIALQVARPWRGRREPWCE